MGFTASLYSYPKYKDLTFEDINTVYHILEYERNSWAQEKFDTAEEYAKYVVSSNYRPQSADAIEFYRSKLLQDEFGSYSFNTYYADWCSNGSGEIYEFFSELGTPVRENETYGSPRLLSKKDIAKASNFFLEHVLNTLPKSSTLKYAYTYERDEENGIPENPKINLIPCDGVEIEFTDNNKIQRIDTNPDWECFIGFPDKYYDEYQESGYIEGLRACIKILGEADFENDMVLYSGGW